MSLDKSRTGWALGVKGLLNPYTVAQFLAGGGWRPSWDDSYEIWTMNGVGWRGKVRRDHAPVTRHRPICGVECEYEGVLPGTVAAREQHCWGVAANELGAVVGTLTSFEEWMQAAARTILGRRLKHPYLPLLFDDSLSLTKHQYSWSSGIADHGRRTAYLVLRDTATGPLWQVQQVYEFAGHTWPTLMPRRYDGAAYHDDWPYRIPVTQDMFLYLLRSLRLTQGRRDTVEHHNLECPVRFIAAYKEDLARRQGFKEGELL